MVERITPDRYRVSSWIKTDETVNGSYPIVFGTEARISPRKWAHITDSDYPRFYRNSEEAEAEVARLNKLGAGRSLLNQEREEQ